MEQGSVQEMACAVDVAHAFKEFQLKQERARVSAYSFVDPPTGHDGQAHHHLAWLTYPVAPTHDDPSQLLIVKW